MYKKLLLTFSILVLIQFSPLEASKNKETFTAVEELFSKEQDINYGKLCAHLHYTFKDPNLLRDALHPMLPGRLKSNSQQHQILELLGDSVMETIIIEKLLNIFPNVPRKHIDKIRSVLAENKTLTDVFYLNLDIEKYLPYPGPLNKYKVCNVLESLVGAIKQDNKANGHLNAEKFLMRLMDSHLFMDKIRAYAGEKGISLVHQITQFQRETLEKICTPDAIENKNSKSILTEVMHDLFHREDPTYEEFTDLDQQGQLFFKSKVTAAEIGDKIIGAGYTIQEAQENAARLALNFLSHGRPFYEATEPKAVQKNFRLQLNELTLILNMKTEKSVTLNAPFFCDIRLKGEVIGQGSGSNIKIAQEAASGDAIRNLVMQETQARENRYRIKIEELRVKKMKR